MKEKTKLNPRACSGVRPVLRLSRHGRQRSQSCCSSRLDSASWWPGCYTWLVCWLVGWFGWLGLVGWVWLGLVGLGLVGFGWVWSVGFGWLDLVRFHWLGWVGLNEFGWLGWVGLGWVGSGRVGSGRVGSGRSAGWLVGWCVCVCVSFRSTLFTEPCLLRLGSIGSRLSRQGSNSMQHPARLETFAIQSRTCASPCGGRECCRRATTPAHQ